tara:strand:- start:826 stop:2205 length:1380 start_codon:yes stop_codon:yes gene_type:complete
MASTYTPLGLELQATGENAGTWGTKTNTNLQIVEQISGGYTTQSIAGGTQTTALSVSDGSTGATMSHRMIEFTGSISGNQIVTIPLDTQNFYFLRNSTSGAYTVQFKYTSGSGDSFTFAAGDKGDALVFATANDGTNPDIDTLPAGDVTLTGTQTLTNKTLTSPKIGTSILDTNGAELFLLTATSSAANEFTIANAANGSAPTLSATGSSDSNIDIALKPKGTGETVIGTGAAAATLTTSGTHDLVLDTNSGTNSGTITITDGTDGAINIAPNGNGVAQVGGSAIKVAGKETIWIPAAAMYAPTTNGADAAQVETTATRPDLKVFDYDASTKQYTQFTIAMPKSWNEGTLTYQVYWSPSTTNTGNCIFGLQGVACADGDTIDVAYGTAIEVTDAGIGTVEDQQITSESSAMTVAGSPAAGEQSYFQLYRDAADGSDTFTGESRVLGIKLFFTTDAANDA